MSLFPLKVRRLFEALSQEGVLDQMVEDAKKVPVGSPADGQKRIALSSPAVLYIARKTEELDIHKVRLAIPPDLNWLYLADGITMEVYDDEDNSLIVPWPLTGLEPEMACAIEAELFSVLLRAKGICIPMQQ